MFQTICLALVLMAAIAETTALRKWQQKYALAGLQQAVAGSTDFAALRPRPN